MLFCYFVGLEVVFFFFGKASRLNRLFAPLCVRAFYARLSRRYVHPESPEAPPYTDAPPAYSVRAECDK